MTRTDEPTPASPKPVPVAAKIVLPRPNLGPEPWSEPRPGFGTVELAVGSIGASLVLALAIRKWQRDKRKRVATRQPDWLAPSAEAEMTPGRRLIASSQVVRAALIAEFGPGWGSRTTEEIARDPGLAGRLGPETAEGVVAYLQRVDRAKFAGDESDDADEWVALARTFLERFPRPSRTAR